MILVTGAAGSHRGTPALPAPGSTWRRACSAIGSRRSATPAPFTGAVDEA